jgi:hypothetical protein
MQNLRARLAKRIAKFPRQIRSEQIRGRLKHLIIVVLFVGACNAFAALVVHLLRKLLDAFNVTIPGFEYFAFIAPFAFGFWACFWPFTRRWDRVFRKLFGIRSRMLRRINQTPIENAIRSDIMLGLHLRAFVDEEMFVPTSREEVPRALQSVESVFFVSVSNPQHDRSASGIYVLEVPSQEWKDTVFELVQIASIIVVDTNAGDLDWSYDIDLAKIENFWAMNAEFGRRIGLIEELREIIAKGFACKTVAVVPPGWDEWKGSGKIEQQIALEKYAEQHAKQLYPLLRPEGEFPRTELKRMLLQLPLTVATEDQLRVAVEGVLSRTPTK